MKTLPRRQFIGTTAATALAISWDNPVFAAPPAEGEGPWDIVAVRNGEPAAMYQAAMRELGGIEAFVKKGQTVVIKPNVSWDQPPEIPANTNPDLLAAVVRDCLRAGAKKVTAFDNTCHNWQRTYKTSGIEKAVTDAGGHMSPANVEKLYREVDLPGAKTMKKARLFAEMLDADVFINMPILKHHGGAKLTICMKNLMGTLWDRRFLHREGLDQCIADLCFSPRKPDLNIVDAYRILRKNGPQAKAAEDGELAKYLMAGRDMVALDAAATRLFGMDPAEIGHIRIAGEMGAGQANLDKVKIKRITLE